MLLPFVLFFVFFNLRIYPTINLNFCSIFLRAHQWGFILKSSPHWWRWSEYFSVLMHMWLLPSYTQVVLSIVRLGNLPHVDLNIVSTLLLLWRLMVHFKRKYWGETLEICQWKLGNGKENAESLKLDLWRVLMKMSSSGKFQTLVWIKIVWFISWRSHN